MRFDHRRRGCPDKVAARTRKNAQKNPRERQVMKYTMRENENGTHTLLRYGAEAAKPRPNNAELEFWLRIEELEEELKESQRETSEAKKALLASTVIVTASISRMEELINRGRRDELVAD
jgi:hypothetical protein